MLNGWVQVVVPEALAARAAHWRVRAGEATGRPGEKIPVAPGAHVVRIEADVTLSALWAACALSVAVRVEPGGLTRVNIAKTLGPTLSLLLHAS